MLFLMQGEKKKVCFIDFHDELLAKQGKTFYI